MGPSSGEKDKAKEVHAVFLTFSPNLVHENLKPELSESKLSFLLGTYQAVVERLRPRIEGEENEEFDQFEELEEYKIVFEMSNFDNGGTPVEVSELEAKENRLSSNEAQITNDTTNQDSDLGVSEVVSDNLSENSVGIITMSETSLQLLSEENKLQVLLHQKQKKLEEFEIQKGEKEVKPLSSNSNKVEEQRESKAMSLTTDEKARAEDNGLCISRVNSQKLGSNPWTSSESMGSNLGSFGSMRKEKEWRRTLACKLFEERHNVEGGEGMDLLWETYETDSIKMQAKGNTKKGKKGNVEYYDDDEEEEESNGQLCCLQALKFSAGKMNLGMGRPSLVKISKALKGIGWLHHVSKKKVYY
ncbi:uncharacterized protein LOC122721245 [Manihot esculenta]|uniref:uncharacterized protein LOC122721245 n=1 Tax=Manihot esculenta TaxID=3983 RepID=UPI001CC68391|nr:uncharacterized protein LOC122721245 [Manihot esculenta]